MAIPWRVALTPRRAYGDPQYNTSTGLPFVWKYLLLHGRVRANHWFHQYFFYCERCLHIIKINSYLCRLLMVLNFTCLSRNCSIRTQGQRVKNGDHSNLNGANMVESLGSSKTFAVKINKICGKYFFWTNLEGEIPTIKFYKTGKRFQVYKTL